MVECQIISQTKIKNESEQLQQHLTGWLMVYETESDNQD